MRLRAAALLGALALTGCGTGFGSDPVVKERRAPAFAQFGAPRRIAIAPFQLSTSLSRASKDVNAAASLGAKLVERHVAQTLESRGVLVVAAHEVGLAAGPGTASATVRLAGLVYERFGADAVLTGVVHRYRQRQGQAAGTLRPAAVGFELVLHAAPGGEVLWKGLFDETQRPLSENVLNAGRYPGGGTRWLSAEDLARWGAEAVSRAVPIRR